MIAWDDLLKTALLGTERQRPPASTAGPSAGATAAMATVLSRLPAGQPDDAILGAAAVIATCRRAAYVPPPEESVRTLPVAAPDDLPQASPRAAQHLRAMLTGERRDLLPEWAAAAAAAGRRAPDVLLPQLLDLARSKSDLRDALRPVLGQRGAWLGSQNSDWSFASGAGLDVDCADAETMWQTGERGARLSLLSGLRRREPAKALALVQSTWATEPADDRTKFVTALGQGLSPADEPFLEAALDDRSKEVRRAAAELLARLPSSQLVRRMTERAKPLLDWKPGKKPKLDVTLPTPPDKSAERDGVEPKPTQGRIGQKQWWLWQILASVPPGTWSKQRGARPAEIVEAVRRGEFENVLVTALARAATRYGDAAWAEAILVTERATVMEWDAELAQQLYALLPPGRRDALILDQLAADGGQRKNADDSAVLVLLKAFDGHWSPKLTRAVVERVRDMICRPKGDYWVASAVLREAATRVPPAMLDELSKGWPETVKAWDHRRGVVDAFLSTVQFRRDMLEEIRR